MKVINAALLATLGTGFSAAYATGLKAADSQYAAIATVIKSSAAANEYGWLGDFPMVREWIGDRVVQGMAAHEYTIRNKDYELTVGVARNDIEDDNLGLYAPRFEQMGRSVNQHKDRLVFDTLAGGFANKCYDGQNYFDTDHPVLGEDGKPTTVSNMTAGAGPAWYLIDDTQVLKPLILQVRTEFQFTAKTEPTSENVFNRKTFEYGYDARMNAGYGFWQMAHASKAVLDATSYEAARVAMRTVTGDHGRKLGIRPSLLVVPPELEGAAMEILNNDRGPNGETNKWKGTAKLLVADWL